MPISRTRSRSAACAPWPVSATATSSLRSGRIAARRRCNSLWPGGSRGCGGTSSNPGPAIRSRNSRTMPDSSISAGSLPAIGAPTASHRRQHFGTVRCGPETTGPREGVAELAGRHSRQCRRSTQQTFKAWQMSSDRGRTRLRVASHAGWRWLVVAGVDGAHRIAGRPRASSGRRITPPTYALTRIKASVFGTWTILVLCLPPLVCR